MNNKEIIEAITLFQDSETFHELTCGNDSNHEALYGAEVDGKVVLKCKNCDYIQTHIPTIVLEVWENKK